MSVKVTVFGAESFCSTGRNTKDGMNLRSEPDSSKRKACITYEGFEFDEVDSSTCGNA